MSTTRYPQAKACTSAIKTITHALMSLFLGILSQSRTHTAHNSCVMLLVNKQTRSMEIPGHQLRKERLPHWMVTLK